MGLNKNKLLLICGAIIVLLVIFILLFQTTTISQNFSFSNFEMTKTILINGENRIETYTFDTENPLIAYLIVPKTIATDISQLTISGDYSTTI
ncbi:MAG TPA: hypothetical protein PKK60_04415, partial [archaeon]|nr:hypothetical protein [archaeon]